MALPSPAIPPDWGYPAFQGEAFRPSSNLLQTALKSVETPTDHTYGTSAVTVIDHVIEIQAFITWLNYRNRGSPTLLDMWVLALEIINSTDNLCRVSKTLNDNKRVLTRRALANGVGGTAWEAYASDPDIVAYLKTRLVWLSRLLSTLRTEYAKMSPASQPAVEDLYVFLTRWLGGTITSMGDADQDCTELQIAPANE